MVFNPNFATLASKTISSGIDKPVGVAFGTAAKLFQPLEQIPQELIVDLVMKLHFCGLHHRTQKTWTAIS